jgi:hypothetical protein
MAIGLLTGPEIGRTRTRNARPAPPRPPAPHLASPRSGSSGRCNFGFLARCNYDYHTGDTWRPRSRAASTNVATTPALIAEQNRAPHRMQVAYPINRSKRTSLVQLPKKRGSGVQAVLYFGYCIVSNFLPKAGRRWRIRRLTPSKGTLYISSTYWRLRPKCTSICSRLTRCGKTIDISAGLGFSRVTGFLPACCTPVTHSLAATCSLFSDEHD